MLANNIQKTIDAIYPVGALYLSMNASNPQNLFGGTWKQLTADAYLKIVTSGASETAKGQTDHKIPLSAAPAHTHTRGTMNITGQFTGGGYNDEIASGAFIKTNQDSGEKLQGGSYRREIIKFDASNSWTGSTSSAGGGGHTIPAISVFTSGIEQPNLLQGGVAC